MKSTTTEEEKLKLIQLYNKEYLQPKVMELENMLHCIIIEFENANGCGIPVCEPYTDDFGVKKRFKLAIGQSPHHSYEIAKKYFSELEKVPTQYLF